jgi:hypothetical protein
MTWSLGEIGALATKAARGSGLDWGLAEEAGYAVKWLQRRQLPGVAALCRYLSWRHDGDITNYPDETGAHGHYCPIAIGAAFSDGAFGDKAQFSRVKTPLLLIPFVAIRTTGKPLEVNIGSSSFYLAKDWVGYTNNDTAILVNAAACQISIANSLPNITITNVPDLPRVPVTTTACVSVLEGFAKNTYAPATEVSRLAGAGAGINDND